LHIHTLAEAYGATVILHTDHCAKKLLPWIDGLLDASEKHFAQTGKPLYSSHMIDLSEETLAENLEICKQYLARMSKMGMTLEIELGITGGEEDGVDNSDVDSSKLYTQPEEVAFAYEELMKISPRSIWCLHHQRRYDDPHAQPDAGLEAPDGRTENLEWSFDRTTRDHSHLRNVPAYRQPRDGSTAGCRKYGANRQSARHEQIKRRRRSREPRITLRHF